MSIDDILEFAVDHNGGEAMHGLPEMRKEILKLPRAYIANIVYTIIGDPFIAWSKAKIEARNKKVV